MTVSGSHKVLHLPEISRTGLPSFWNVSFFITKVDPLFEVSVSFAFTKLANRAVARSKTGICLFDIAMPQKPTMYSQ